MGPETQVRKIWGHVQRLRGENGSLQCVGADTFAGSSPAAAGHCQGFISHFVYVVAGTVPGTHCSCQVLESLYTIELVGKEPGRAFSRTIGQVGMPSFFLDWLSGKWTKCLPPPLILLDFVVTRLWCRSSLSVFGTWLILILSAASAAWEQSLGCKR